MFDNAVKLSTLVSTLCISAFAEVHVKPRKLEHARGHKIVSNNRCVRIYRSYLSSNVLPFGFRLNFTA